MASPTNLNEYYQNQGQALPSLSSRGQLYQSYGLGNANTYGGSVEQNTALLGKLTTPTMTPSGGMSVAPQVSTPTATTAPQQTTATTPSPASNSPQVTISVPTGTSEQGAQTTASQGQTTTPFNGSVVDLLNASGENSSYENRAKLAQQYGINGYSGTAAQNIDLAKKYQEAHAAMGGSAAPESGAAGRQAVADYMQENQQQPEEDPQKSFFDNYMTMNPIVKQVYDEINHELSTPVTTTSFADEYKKAFSDVTNPAGTPGESLSDEQLKYMNIKNIMDGTEDDIRTEIGKAGGFATESQVQALSTARNKTLLKQAQVLQQSMALKQDYVDQLMQFSEKDRTAVEAEVDRKLGLTEKLADLQDKITTAAKDNYQKIADSVGYAGLAKALGNDTHAMSMAESVMGLPKGALSNASFTSSGGTKNAPASVQEYEYAKTNGYTGSFTDYQNEDANRKRSIAAASQPTFTTDENGNVIQVGNYDALTIGRYNKAANSATAILQKNPTFKNITGSSAYLDRIEAASSNPGSVGDQELLDAFTQLNTGGNRVTEAQVNLITRSQSLADWQNKLENRLKTGGALSSQQRTEIVNLSQAVYKKYQDSYLPLYNDAVSRLEAQGIPKEFWNIPSPDTLSRAVSETPAAQTKNYQVENLKSQLQAGELLVARENKDGTRHYVAIKPSELWATDIQQ